MRPLEGYITVAALYWILTAIFTFFQSRLERRMSKGYVRAAPSGPRTRAPRKATLAHAAEADPGAFLETPAAAAGGHSHAGGTTTAEVAPPGGRGSVQGGNP